MDDISKSIIDEILTFRNDRDWAQFHDPKNLVEALNIEAAELQEIFLWKSTEESKVCSKEDVDRIKDELADIFIFMTYLCDHFHINIFEAVKSKLKKNKVKYPIEKAKGNRKKYSEL